MSEPNSLKTFLWFNDGLHGALKFYKKIFGDEMNDFLGDPDWAKAQQNMAILRQMKKIQLSDFVD